MTPRAAARGAGLRGPGQEIFPEAAKEAARNIALEERAAQIWVNNRIDDGGGDSTSVWEKRGTPVDGRIDELGKRGTGGELVADQINEATTHIISLDPSAEVNSGDRIEINGRMWTLTGNPSRTDQATIRLQARELRT